MTVSSTSTSVSYTGDASTTSFPVTFAFFGTGTDAELRVIERVIATGVETVLVNGTDYTVTGGSGSTGAVVATTAPAATKRWTIERATTQTQETDYVENDPFPAETHEAALDRLTMIGQEGYSLADRSFKFAASSSTTASTAVPDPSAGAALVWNSGGTALENGPTTTEISNAQTYATNASNSAASAASSASTATTQAGLAATAKTAAETAETNAETAQAAAEAAQALAEAAAAAAEVSKIEWKGAWSSLTAYALNDAVSYGGSSWICVQAHTNQTPADNAYWDPLAVKGTDGAGSGDFMADGSVPMTGNLTLGGAGTGIIFEGATADAFETTLTAGEPTADRAIALPNASGTLLLSDGDGSALAGTFKAYRVTSTSDVALGTCASGGTAVGSTFSAAIPASGKIRIAVNQAQFNWTQSAGASIGIGIRINSVTYFVQQSFGSGGTLSYAPGWGSNAPNAVIKSPYQNRNANSDGLIVEMDVGAIGCATGAQTCQVYLGHTAYTNTDAVTVKGTVTTTVLSVEIIPEA